MNTMYKLMLACMIVLATALSSQATIVQFNGAVDLTYVNWGKDGQSSGIPTFDAYEVYLLGRADISEKVSGYFELRTEHAEGAALRQGYLKWTLAESVKLTMGYFYTPMGQYWLRYYASTRELVSYAYAMRLINVTPWGEAGIMMSGDIPVASAKVSYAVALINGLNQKYATNKPRDARQFRDNNENKMVAGRLGIAPVEELEVGVSFAGGKYDDAGTRHLQLMDVDLALNIADFTLRGEWVQSQMDSVANGEPVTSSGFYVHAGYKLLKDKCSSIHYVMPVVRYEMVDAGQAMKDVFTIDPATTGKVTAITAGLCVCPVEHFLLKAEYRWTTEELDPQLENNAFSFQGCVDF